MDTNRDALLGITGYPIPQRSVEVVALRRGLDLDEGATLESMVSRPFRLCEADLLMWLLRAPNVSQGGQSYNFTEEQRKDMRRRANAIYTEEGENAAGAAIAYGYKGAWI